MKRLFLNIFYLSVFSLFSIITFAGEGESYPDDAGSATPPSGGGEGTGGGSTMDQTGRSFDPKEAKGGASPPGPKFQYDFGKNPLDHKIVKDFLNYVDTKIYLKKAELRKMQEEQRNQLIKAKERIQIDKEYVDLRLKQWVDSWQKTDAVKKNIETKSKELGAISEQLRKKDITYEKQKELWSKQIQLQNEMMDAVQEKEKVINQEKAAGDSLQHSMQSLKRDTQQFEQMKNNMQAVRNDVQSAPPPGK